MRLRSFRERSEEERRPRARSTRARSKANIASFLSISISFTQALLFLTLFHTQRLRLNLFLELLSPRQNARMLASCKQIQRLRY